MFSTKSVAGVLSLSASTIAAGHLSAQKSARKKPVAPGSSQEVKELKETVAAQQKQIDDLKAIVERLAAANEKALGSGLQAADTAEQARSAALQAQKQAQQAQTAADTSEKDAQHAEFSAAEANTNIAKDGDKLAAKF